MLRRVLPRLITTTNFRPEMQDLTVPEITADPSLGRFSPNDPALPEWLRPVISQSRVLADAEVQRTNPPIGIPVAPQEDQHDRRTRR